MLLASSILFKNGGISRRIKHFAFLNAKQITNRRGQLLFSSSSSNDEINKMKIDLDAINKRVEDDLEKSKAGKETELDKTFMNFTTKRNKKASDGFSIIMNWKYVAIFSASVGAMLVVLYITWKIKANDRERNRKRAIGRARIGGDWELINMEGKQESSKDYIGKWLLIYFGFTNCPDICPDEIEKMMNVVDTLDREERGVHVLPLFISVDPERDTVERVKKYCSEFSPKLRGFTGTKEQVDKVTKSFRIYHSEGPKNAENDYIVDHTVIMYLIAPDGQFHDYFGQNRRASEIATAIRAKILMWELEKKKEESWLQTFVVNKKSKDAHQKEVGAVA